MHCGLTSSISFGTSPSPLVQWTLFMHGRRSFVSSRGTVVYTLNCEHVHSSASDGGHIGFVGKCLTSKMPAHLLGFQNKSDWTRFKFYEKGHSELELAPLWSPTGILRTQLSHAMWKGLGNKHWRTTQLCIFGLHPKASFWLYVHDLSPNWPCTWTYEFILLRSLSCIPA